MRARWLGTMLLILVTFAGMAHAVTIDVTGTTDAVGTCTGTSMISCTSLRAAITYANTHAGADQINVPAGTYKITVTPGTAEHNNASGDFDLRSEMTITGANRDTTFLDGNDADRVFQAINAKVTLRNVTVRNGRAATTITSGAGYYNGPGSTLVAENVAFTNNRAFSSGATVSQGGALFNAGTMTLTNVTVSENLAQQGSGLFNSGTLSLSAVGFSGNPETLSADSDQAGGAFYQTTGTLVASSSTFSNSGHWLKDFGAKSIDGGVGYLVGGSATFTNSRFEQVGAATESTYPTRGKGGAFYIKDATLSITGTTDPTKPTFLGVSAPLRGGGIYAEGNAVVSLDRVNMRGGISGERPAVYLNQDWVGCDLTPWSGGGGGGFLAAKGAAQISITRSVISGETKPISVCEGSPITDLKGGAILLEAFTGSLSITQTSLEGDAIGYGGAMAWFAGGGTATLVNAVLTGTSSEIDANPGHGIWLSSVGGQLRLANTTIDTFAAGGSALVNQGGAVTLRNSVVTSVNEELCLGGTLTSQGYNALTEAGCPLAGTDVVSGSLGLDHDFSTHIEFLQSQPQRSFFRSYASSPLRDGGDPTGCRDFDGVELTEDVIGRARTTDGNDDGILRCDIGAIEERAVRTVGFTQPVFFVNENAGPASVTIATIGSSSSTAGLKYTLSTATGTANASDFTSVADAVFVTAASLPITRTIVINNDALAEGAETFKVNLAIDPGATSFDTVVGRAQADVTIVDDEVSTAGTLSITTATKSVGENLSTVQLVVSRTGGSTGNVAVSFATENGTATAGSDYSATSGTLNWTNGDTADKTITITITNDTIDENNETFLLRLSAPTNGATLGTSPATITILDDDTAMPGTLQFSIGTSQGNEGTRNGVVLTRTGGSDNAVSIDYTITGGTATSDDHDLSVSGTIGWAAGASGNKSLSIGAVKDLLDEADETIVITLSNPTGGAVLGATTTHTFTIKNVAAPTISFDTTAVSIGEAATTVTLSLRRTGGTAAASVDVSTAAGTATAGNDFTSKTSTVTWAAADTSAKSFVVTLLPDTIYEGDEMFSIQLSNPTGAVLGASSATVTITEDDAVPVQNGTLAFAAASYSIGEGAGAVVVTVTRSGGSDGVVGVDVVASAGTATAGADFTASTQPVSFASGDTTPKDVTIAILQDATIETGGELFTVSLSNASGGATVGTPATATVSIVDDDSAGILAFAPKQPALLPESGSATFSVQRTAGSSGAVSLSYTTAGITATAGTDFTTASGTLSWADGNTEVKTITVAITPDLLFEADETLSLQLSNATGGATIGGAASATLTIVNDDPQSGYLALVATESTALENAGDVVIEVSRTGSTSGAASVSYRTVGESAAPIEDYEEATGVLSWVDGEGGTKTFTVKLLDDSIEEAAETLTIELFNPSSNSTLAGSTATLTITDDDGPPDLLVVDLASIPDVAPTVDLDGNSGTLDLGASSDDLGIGSPDLLLGPAPDLATSVSDLASPPDLASGEPGKDKGGGCQVGSDVRDVATPFAVMVAIAWLRARRRRRDGAAEPV